MKRAALIAHPYLPMAQCSEGITGGGGGSGAAPQHFGSLKDGGDYLGVGGGGAEVGSQVPPTYIPQHPLVAVILLCARMWGFRKNPLGVPGPSSQGSGAGWLARSFE